MIDRGKIDFRSIVMAMKKFIELEKIVFIRGDGMGRVMPLSSEMLQIRIDGFAHQLHGYDAATIASSFTTSALHDGHFKYSPRFCEYFTTMNA